MANGIKVWDASGNLVFNTGDRVSRLTGTVAIPAGSTGSVNVPNASQGSIWYAVLVNNGATYSPTISISGATISWSTPSILGPPVDAIMLYGVY